MSAQPPYFGKLARYYLWYTGCFALFLVAVALLEQEGMPRLWIGHLFMFATIALYAIIGVICRTSSVTEYYVAGRRVPAMFNGMATAADWIWRPASSAWPAAFTCRVSTVWPSSWAGPAALCWSRC